MGFLIGRLTRETTEIPRGRFHALLQATFGKGGQDARSAGPPARYACNPPSDGVTGGFSESASQDCNLSLPKANQSDDRQLHSLHLSGR